MIDEVNYGSLITTTKCYKCIHFPLCIEQKGGVNLEFASENDCCYYQSKLPDKDSIVLSREEFSKALTDNFNMGKKEAQFYSERVVIPTTRKETAEKFLQLAYDRCLEKSFIKKVEELAEQFGVEIKE